MRDQHPDPRGARMGGRRAPCVSVPSSFSAFCLSLSSSALGSMLGSLCFSLICFSRYFFLWSAFFSSFVIMPSFFFFLKLFENMTELDFNSGSNCITK
jgi:hypothetical protein